ncbi:MFS transporter [Azotosporobacter soli]|uniref:MFS transporter n=1 Tax=Azotosporobacter soli TaxID=3055040 RepID=UPI0031FEAAC1
MNWRRNLWALALGSMLSASSYTMVIPFLPLYLLDIGVDEKNVNLWSGVIFSATFLVAALLAPYWGRQADKSGKRRMVLRAGFSLAAVYFLGAFVQSPLQLLGVRILQGVANGFVPASLAIVATSVPSVKLGSSLGLMQTTLLIGTIIGPLAGGVLSHLFGMRASFVIAALVISLGTLAVRHFVVEPPEKEVAPSTTIREDFKTAFGNARLMEMLALMFVVQMATMAIQPLITLYVAQLQGQMEGAALAAGIIYSLAGIAGAIAAPTWGRLGQAKGFFRILTIGFIGAGLFNVGQYFAPDLYRFALLQFFFGLFVVGVYPAINTLAVTSSDAGFQGRIFGLTTTANQFGSMTGPLIGGLISSAFGIRPVFFFTGSLLILVGIFVLLKHMAKKQVKEAVSDAG